MKKLLFVLLAVSVATWAFAHGQGESTKGSAPKAQVLRVSAPPWIFKKFPLENVAQRFEKAHPGVTVKLTRVGEWNATTYITQWRSGSNTVDVGVGGTGSMLGPLISGDYLTPLGSLLTGKMAKDKFVGGFLAAGHYKKPKGQAGNYYPVVPFMGEVAILGVNTKLMKKAGLWQNGNPVPIPSWNQQAFLGWFNKLKAASPAGALDVIWNREFMQYNWDGALRAMEGHFQAPNGQGFDVSSQAAHNLLSLYRKMHADGIGAWQTTDANGYQTWKTGATGAFYAAQSHIMELVNVTHNTSDIAYVGWPGASQNGSVIWTHSAWIPKLAKNTQLGKEFISQELFSAYFQQWSFNHYGKLPSLKAYYGDGITRFKSDLPLILKIADHSKPIPLYTDMQKYLDILQKYLPAAAYGRMSVDEALSQIQSASQGLNFTDLRAQ